MEAPSISKSEFGKDLSTSYIEKTSSNLRLAPQNLTYVVIVAIILAAVVLRLFDLGKTNFWYDEMASLRYAADLSVFDVHPPFYYAILNILLKFNQSEFILRLPSVVAGILSVIFIYLTGRQLFDCKTTIIGTLLASISPIMIWHAQEARMYSQALLFAVMSVYFYLLILKNGSRFAWIGYAISAILAVYSHLYTGLIPLTLSLHLLLFRRDLFFRWAIAQIIVVLSYLPWILILASLPTKQIGSGRTPSILHFFYNYYAFTSGYSLGPTINDLRTPQLSVIVPYLPLIVPLAVITLVLIGAGAIHLLRTNHQKAMLILLWATLPVLIAVIIPIFRQSMIFNVRYVLVALPAYVWILASGITKLGQRSGAIALIVVITYNGISLYNHYFNPLYTKEDVRSAATYVAQESSSDDHILVITVGSLFNWYFHSSNLVMNNNESGAVSALVTRATADTDTLWLIESRTWQTDSRGEIRSYLDNNYRLIEEESFPGVKVYRYCVKDCEP